MHLHDTQEGMHIKVKGIPLQIKHEQMENNITETKLRRQHNSCCNPQSLAYTCMYICACMYANKYRQKILT